MAELFQSVSIETSSKMMQGPKNHYRHGGWPQPSIARVVARFVRLLTPTLQDWSIYRGPGEGVCVLVLPWILLKSRVLYCRASRRVM